MADPSRRAAEGAVLAGEHVLPLRVYYEDTDTTGVVYYANYLKFAERGRTEFLRALDLDHGRLLADDDVHFVVRSCLADYQRPARLDDRLEVRTRLAELRRASMRMEQDVTRAGEHLVRLDVRLACVGRDGRPVRLPARLREKFTIMEQNRASRP